MASGAVFVRRSPSSAFRSPSSRLRALSFSEAVGARAWAEEEFGDADLGDARRTVRLVEMTAAASLQPAGTLTKIFANRAKELETAYDFLENSAINPDDIAAAHHATTAARCRAYSFVFLAVDGSSLRYPDRDGSRGMGRIGADDMNAKGLKILPGLAVSPDGVPLGLLGQSVWVRGPKTDLHRHLRRTEDKETRYWHSTIEQSQDVLDQEAPGVMLWPQLDREGDSWSLLLDAINNIDCRWVTVRASTNRNLVRDRQGHDESEPGGKLFDALARAPIDATYGLEVPAGPSRRARTATMSVRWAEVTLLLRDQRTGQRHPAPLFAVWVRESGTTPDGEKPIEWVLLTTYCVENAQDALLVVFGYSQRWRIEELFAALKSRGCNVEESLLQAADHIRRFLAIMLTVAVRLLRLAYLGRIQPHLPAAVELTRCECQALLLGSELDPDQADDLTIGDALLLLAKLGGHVGNPAKRPVGYEVLGRGLRELRPLERLFARGVVA